MSVGDHELDALAQEFAERVRRGEAPAVEDYVRAHPHLEADLRELLPVLAVVEGLKGARPRFRLPASVGEYRVGREIGRGGMGTVFEARRGSDGERVALKVVHPHLLSRVEFVARFLREAEAGRRVVHPSLVRTLGLGLVDIDGDEVPYLVLEFVQGQDLRALLDEVEVVPERLCRHIGARLAAALAAIHDAGFVHRDVKPENVVITAAEEVKLMDLGVAVGREGGGHVTRTGEFVGSVLYAAPGQLRGEAPDPAWDLHALGVLLFELATGRHPALPTQPTHVPPSRFTPELSPFYDGVVGALLQPEEGACFESAHALRVTLETGETAAWWRNQPSRRSPVEGWLPVERRTTFRGRRAELDFLDALLDDVREGAGRALLLIGDAGIGKTRLLHEWVSSFGRTPSPRVLFVRHDPDTTDDAEARLREILAARTPLVAVFEDIHLASPPEQERVVRLIRAVRRANALVVVSARSSPSPDWAGSLDGLAHVRRIDLGGLDPAACRDLVRDAAPTGFEVPEAVRAVAERSDRNPLFLLELVRGAERDGSSLPPSLRGLLARRLGSVGAEDRELLEAAACSGQEFDPLLVADAAEVGHIAALKRFGRLERQHDLLRSVGHRYTFQPHLLQEVIHEGLHPAMRQAYHRALAERLEARGPVGGAEGVHASHLCHHHLEAGQPARARPHLHRALAYLAWECHRARRAEALAERGLSDPRALDPRGRAMALWLRGRRRFLAGGEAPRVQGPLEEALELCRAAGDKRLEFEIRRSLGHVHRALGHVEAMEAAYLAAAEAAAATDDPENAAMAFGSLALELSYRGRLDDAEATIRRGFEAIEGRESPSREGRLTNYLARIKLKRGDLEEAARFFERAQVLAHGVGDLPTEAVNLDGLGQLAFVEGRYADAVDFARRSLEVKQATGIVRVPIDTLANLSLCLTHLGRFDEALDAAEEAVRLSEDAPDAKKTWHARMRRGAVRMARGELALALDDLEPAHTHLAESGRPAFRVAVAAAWAELCGLLGRRARAWTALEAVGAAVAARGRLLELEGRFEAAKDAYVRAREEARPGTAARQALALPLARVLGRLGDAAAAQPLLDEALAWGRASGALRFVVLAEVHLAASGALDLLAPRVALEKSEAFLSVADRLEAYATLWRAGGDTDDLRRARESEARLVAGAPAADRARMRALSCLPSSSRFKE